VFSEEGIGPAPVIACRPGKAWTFLPLAQERSQSSPHVPPRTPLPRAANIRSVHTDAATHDHVRGSSGSVSGLAVARTVESAISVLCIALDLSSLPSCPPSLGAGLLSALSRPALSPNLRNLFVFSVCRLVSRRCHPIGSLARASWAVRYCEGSDSWVPSPRRPGLPTYGALPSDRSTSNHSMHPTIALTATSA
jgi:hypothetical protein